MNLNEDLNSQFIYRALTVADMVLLHHWFQEPIVKTWCARSTENPTICKSGDG